MAEAARHPAVDRIGQALEATWLVAAVAVPLVCNPWGANAFELPKTALLRALIVIACAVLLLSVISNRESLAARVRLIIRARGLPTTRPFELSTLLLSPWPTILFAGTLILATALSVDPGASFWGTYERQQGIVTLVGYIGLFLVVGYSLRGRDQVLRLWRALVWASAPVVAYGLIQAAGFDPMGWNSDGSPVLSTLGRANFLGSYLVPIVPLTAALAATTRKRWPYAILLAAQLTCLAFTQTRGAWIGLLLGACIFAAVYLMAAHRRRLGSIVAVAGILLVVALTLGSSGLLPSAIDAGDSGQARLAIWRTTLPLAMDRPWLGYGPETMGTAFASVFPPELVYYQGREAMVDRAHNLWLDLGMSAGIVGLLCFVALLIGFGATAWRGLRAAAACGDRLLWLGLLAAVAGFLCDMQFSFPTTATATVFWLVLALTVTLWRTYPSSTTAGIATRETADLRAASIISWRGSLVGIACLALVGFLCLRPLVADVSLQQARTADRPAAERLRDGQRAVDLWPLEPTYHLELSRLHAQAGAFADAEARLIAAERLRPLDPRLASTRGDLYWMWSTSEPDRLAEAADAYRRATTLAPNVATYHAALGIALAQLGKLDEGTIEVERAVDLDSTDWVAYGYLADLYQAQGRESEASRAREESAYWKQRTEVDRG